MYNAWGKNQRVVGIHGLTKDVTLRMKAGVGSSSVPFVVYPRKRLFLSIQGFLEFWNCFDQGMVGWMDHSIGV